MIDDTHDPAFASSVESANDPATDFPIQNLPFGRFRSSGEWRIGVARAMRCSTSSAPDSSKRPT